MEVAKNPQQVSRIYEKWVVGEKSEGVVVRGDHRTTVAQFTPPLESA